MNSACAFVNTLLAASYIYHAIRSDESPNFSVHSLHLLNTYVNMFVGVSALLVELQECRERVSALAERAGRARLQDTCRADA